MGLDLQAAVGPDRLLYFRATFMNPPLRIVFFGTPDFAEASLRALAASEHEVVGVVTAPDRKAGRGQQLQPSRVKVAAEELGLPMAQPEKLRNPLFLDILRSWNADVFAVVAFRMLPEVVWSMPPRGTINVHGSLLPDFRGAAPIQHAVAAGVNRTGVTSFFITREIDTGGLLLQRAIDVSSTDTAGSVYQRLMAEGAELMVDTMEALRRCALDGVPQSLLLDGTERPAPKLFRQNGRVDWRHSPTQVRDFIRGMTPFPGAWTTLNGATMKLQDARLPGADEPQPEGLAPGDCRVQDGAFWVGTASGCVQIQQGQFAGKPFMPILDLLNGYRFPVESLGTDGH